MQTPAQPGSIIVVRESFNTLRDNRVITVPVDRLRLFFQGLLWAALAATLGLIAVLVYSRLQFKPTGVSNRLVDYSYAVVALPLLVVVVIGVAKAAAALAMSLWPVRMGVVAGPDTLELRLGPHGTRRYDAARLDVKYAFEFADDEQEDSFESYLPEEQQKAQFLPRIRHPDSAVALKELILRYAKGSESDLAARLGPAIEHWRAHRDWP